MAHLHITTLQHSLYDMGEEDVVDLAPQAVRVRKVGRFRPPAKKSLESFVGERHTASQQMRYPT